MKRFYGIWMILTLQVLAVRSQDLTGPDIIKHVDKLMNPESSHGTLQMTITTSSGQKRVFKYESWSKNHGEKNLMRYLEPRRVKDQAILMLNNADDIWMYFPRTQRVRKLATHAKKQKMEGSDFNYEDMGSGDSFMTDYTARRLDDQTLDGQDCYVIELKAKPEKDLSYSRLLFWCRKDDYVPVQIEYYDENHPDRLLKTLTQSDIRVIDGIPTGMSLVMTNDTDRTQTSMKILSVSYNQKIDDALFTERGMKP